MEMTRAGPYKGGLPLKQDDSAAFLVRARFLLADKTNLTGMALVSLFPGETSLSSPTILTDAGQVDFSLPLTRANDKDIDEAISRLGKPASKIFPLRYETDVPIEGGPLKGEIAGFETRYSYKDQDKEPHQVNLVFKTAGELQSAIKASKGREAARKKADRPSKDEQALLKAAENGDTPAIKALLSKGADVNRGGRSEYGPYPYIAKGVTPLMLAAEKGHIEAIRALLDAGADVGLAAETNEPRQSGKTALAYACLADQIEVARLLLPAGADPNHKLSYGQSIFDEVCGKNGIGMIRLLLASGANPDEAIRMAAEANRLDVVRLLIEHDANINGTDHKGETALMKASELLRPEMVRVLLNHGADVTLKRKPAETTALHQAVLAAKWLDPDEDAQKFSAAMEVIRALVEKGADANAPDIRGMTPLTMAKDCKFPELAAYLSGKR